MTDSKVTRFDKKSGMIEIGSQSEDLFEHAFECVARIDHAGYLINLNSSFAQQFDSSPESMHSRHWLEFIHKDDRELASAAYQEMLDMGRGEFDARAIKKEGLQFFMRAFLIKGINRQDQK